MNWSVSEFARWDAGCWSYGSSVINSYHQADDYGQPYPCPNGLGLSEHTTANCPAWRRRLEKARQDAEQHREHINWQDIVIEAHQSIPSDEVGSLKAFCEGLFT